MTAAQSLHSRHRGPGASASLDQRTHPESVEVRCETPPHGLLGRVRVSPSGKDAIHISDLWVREPFRGQQLGGLLLAKSLGLGARWGRRRAWLEARDRGSGHLLRWYQRLGFHRSGLGPHGKPRFEMATDSQSSQFRRLLGTQARSSLPLTFRAVPTPARVRRSF